MAEILPNVHQILVEYHGRPLKLYLLIGDTGTMLMDTGGPGTPDADILPYFKKINFDPARLTWIMCTHPDTDHSGGLSRMKQVAPQAKFCCGTMDRRQIESPEAIVNIRSRAYFYWHGMGPDDAARPGAIAKAGGYTPMDVTFTGGEEIRLGKDLLAQVLHLPGHSRGHLGVYLAEQNTAIIADAVHGTANRNLDGSAAFGCTYMYVDEYLGTIDKLRCMRLERIFSCHWRDCSTKDEVASWLDESRDYALRAEGVILEAIKRAPGGLTLAEACVKAKPGLGDWPAERDDYSKYMVHGHLTRLVNMGYARVTGERPVKYVYEPVWLGLR
jgi:glyoxylase-like metal-dependent hydrolase (beta-lactamase superfamily II)